jgi:hypothetical protein
MENKEQAAEQYAHNHFNMHDLNHYKALENGFIAGASWQSSQPINNGWVSVERAKKYARHQHYLGSQGHELVEFEDWEYKAEAPKQ